MNRVTRLGLAVADETSAAAVIDALDSAKVAHRKSMGDATAAFVARFAVCSKAAINSGRQSGYPE